MHSNLGLGAYYRWQVSANFEITANLIHETLDEWQNFVDTFKIICIATRKREQEIT